MHMNYFMESYIVAMEHAIGYYIIAMEDSTSYYILNMGLSRNTEYSI